MTQTSKDSLNIDDSLIINGDLTVSGKINGETGGGGTSTGATITASDGNGVYSYANITYDNGNITNITSNPTPVSGSSITAANGNGTYDYCSITYDNGNITNIVSNPIPVSGSSITASGGNATYSYANITYDNGNITNITSNPAPVSSTITASGGDATYTYANITYSNGNITNITSNPTPTSGGSTITAPANGTYNYATIAYSDGDITNITNNDNISVEGKVQGTEVDTQLIKLSAYSEFNSSDDTQKALIQCTGGDLKIQPTSSKYINLNGPTTLTGAVSCSSTLTASTSIQSPEVDVYTIKITDPSKFSSSDQVKAIIQYTGTGDLKITPPGGTFSILLNDPVNCTSSFRAPASMQSGVGTVYNSGTITFPQAFNGVHSVVATSSIIVSTGGVWRGFLGVYNVTTTSFDITLWQSDFKDPNADWTFYWIAMVSYY